MKILYYSPHPDLNLASPTGYGTHMREMIAAFERAGHQVETLIRGGETLPETSAGPSPGRRGKQVLKKLLPNRLWESAKHRHRVRGDQSFEADLERRINECSPDLIYERSAYLQPSGVNVASRLKVPHVLEINTPVNAERHYLGQPNSHYEDRAEEIEKQQLALTTLAVVVSPAMIDYFVEKHGADRDKIICTPNGIDLQGLATDDNVIARVCQELGLKDRRVVGFVGCMARWQRVDLLLDALPQTIGKHPDLLAVLVGGTSEKIDQLQQHAMALGVADHVRFTGSVPRHEVSSYVVNMEVCVLPDNLWYGSPTKIFEYGALRRPTIAPDNVTMRSIIEDGVHGRLIDADVATLAETIGELLDAPERAQQLGEAFHDRVTSEFTWDANVVRIEAALSGKTEATVRHAG